ncbi:MAG: hypothetical protein IJK87_15745 [Prevotella sp.]|nr:hypothetical protein [Prevotella sp.]
MKDESFDFDSVPSGYALCFNNSCPLSDQCLRHLAGEHVPTQLTRGASVYPNAYANGKCKHFKQVRIVNAARGFGDILANVRRNDYPAMRQRLLKCVGTGGTFYRYRNGERLLMPEQQDAIRKVFRDFGYDDNVQFNGYVTVYDFS